ncbi:double-strand break repair protein AddB [Rhodobacteraceae bacterium XHP0102]|nr:double-strand break repair protein AddB [Rhodobacteraceae bacterium XHP0102]
MTQSPKSRVFATPIGLEFTSALVAGLDARLQGQPPEALARVEIWVNSARMERNLRAHYLRKAASFLPRIRPFEAMAHMPDLGGMTQPASDLRLRLHLAQLVGQLLNAAPDLAPRASIWSLADSLADLLGEMHEERVAPAVLEALNVEGHSEHWQRNLKFIQILRRYFEANPDLLTQAARQSSLIDRLARKWQDNLPDHPVIIAGSTGSRGATARLMKAVATLPNGAVVLPGLDYEMPAAVWSALIDTDQPKGGLTGQDHPQYRLAKFANDMGIRPWEIAKWVEDTPLHPKRNALISLALRPAPQTDQWLAEGPRLADPRAAMDQVTLIEAETPRDEAMSIALGLRHAIETGQRVALICPDRILVRQVCAILSRWSLIPDDSAGVPLGETATGRFLRHVSDVMLHPITGSITGEALLVLLKHPLCHSGRDDRGLHLQRTRDLELEMRKKAWAFPKSEAILNWARDQVDDPEIMGWAEWVCTELLEAKPLDATGQMARFVEAHIAWAEALARGPSAHLADHALKDGERAGALWQENAGTEAYKLMQGLVQDADAAGAISLMDYRDLFAGVLSEAMLRNPVRPHADLLIWGPMEARVQGADMLILAGLNEGVWPSAASADPWLNRTMRAEAGLRLPDRRIGLAAHDFQQALGANQVWLTRAKRDAESATVPSRWLNRVTNLLKGSSDDSRAALDDMRARGAKWMTLAKNVDQPEPHERRPRAKRPAPKPPRALRPKSLSVTQIETLVRDPYAIYARNILDLHKLGELNALPKVTDRGTALHRVLEGFIAQSLNHAVLSDFDRAKAALLQMADEVLTTEVPWPSAQRIWRAKVTKFADWFIQGEMIRRKSRTPELLEARGSWPITTLDFTLTGSADRVDRDQNGALWIYDYKAGSAPSDKQEKNFKKQLWLEALMACDGAFTQKPETVAGHGYLALGKQEDTSIAITATELDQMRESFFKLIREYQNEQKGYISRRAVSDLNFEGDYDHLARFGEWDDTDTAEGEAVG